jgi:oxygen-independent coproporphyrinogen-3 oxidase
MPHQFADRSPKAAYIHVPFCVHRCGYCDFTLVARRDDLIGDYLQALELDLQSLRQPQPVETLFLGGGTPTHLPPLDLARLMKLVRDWFPLEAGHEFSVEANPAGLTVEKIRILADAGVNRVSLGVQSFDDEVLKFLERDHRKADILLAVENLQKHIPNISLDLIFGVPGQSRETWQASLQAAIKLKPRHVSTYGLTFEKGTAFWNRLSKGAILRTPEDLERDMYALAMDDLRAAGFEQYEISNFAKPGFRCRHNETYWKSLPYFGFGPGAARYENGRRSMNHRSVTTWIKHMLAGESPIMDMEQLSEEDRARELCVLGLRMCAGVDRAEFETRTGCSLESLAATAIKHHLENGLLEQTESHLRLTREGRFVADSVVADFL